MNTTFFHTNQLKILKKVLKKLLANKSIVGYALIKENKTIFGNGATSDYQITRPFAELELLVYGEPGFDTPDIERQIKSLRKLCDVMLRGVSEKGTMQMGFLVDSYLEILLLLEERINLLNFYEKVLHLNKSILMADDLFGVLQSIMDMACKACNGEGASLLLVDQKTGEMYFNVVSGDNRNILKEIRIPNGQGIAGSVVNSAIPEIVRDVKNDPRSFQRVDKVLKHETRDMIIAPIKATHNVMGVLEVINCSRAAGFSSEDLDFLINISNHTALFIENIKAKEDLIKSNRNLDRKNSELHTLYEIGQELNSSLDPKELKQKLLTTLLKILPIDHGKIFEIKNQVLSETFQCDSGKQTSILDSKSSNNLSSPTDLLLWLNKFKEPFAFHESDGTMRAIVERFIEANQAYYKQNVIPDLWVPIFDEADNIIFIISLCGTQFRRQIPVSDLKFFQSIMNLCYTAFRNVDSYNEAIKSRKREEHLRRSFQKYVPARVVANLLEDADPRPTQQTVSVLFADIRNFTHLSETMEPYELVQLLNTHFESLVEAVTIHGGIVDKFMGDSLMAVFGIPETNTNDASNALQAAAEMKKRLLTQAIEKKATGQIEFEVGIGLHTGSVIAGNIGSQSRMDYTIVGETVNLASRLEKAVKYYKIQMLFTEATLQAIPNYPCREVDILVVRGSTNPIRIYEPLTYIDSNLSISEFSIEWEAAIKDYQTKNFGVALDRFNKIFDASKNQDPVALLYIKRCKDFLAQPPALDWQAIFHIET